MERFFYILNTLLTYLAEGCNLKDGLRQGQFLLYRPLLYIQQWICAVNEMEGKKC